MDLALKGRHALLFDDDATAAFVNSGDALVPWSTDASLLIDRYDVRHLLDRLPPRPTAASAASRRRLLEGDLSSELDRERYLDLPPHPLSDEEDGAALDEPLSDATKASSGGFQAVPFSYDTVENSAILEMSGFGSTSSGYRPPFPIPESLLSNLPPTEKLHHIIARTAMFISEHGGQSEIVLRVKQGDNPTFGFLMPDHHLHLYYRFLVDHPQLLKTDKTHEKEKLEDRDNELLAAPGGALSLLGSVYGSGEDDDGIQHSDDKVIGLVNSCETAADTELPPRKIYHREASTSDGLGDKKAVDHSASVAMPKEKIISIKKNLSVNSSIINGSQRKKIKDVKTSSSDAMEKLKNATVSYDKTSILEAPSFMKRMIDKVVDIVRRNGKESESILVEQDKAVGRYPFLLPSNQYHTYYLKALQDACEGNSGSKNKVPVKTAKKSSADDTLSDFSEGWLYDSQRKEKFKMVIGGTKKESQDQHPVQAPVIRPGVSTDEAAAIVLAATRGVSPANVQCLSANASISTGKYGEGQNSISKPNFSNDAGSSLHSSSQQLENEYSRKSDDVWIAKAIAKSAALVASSEADSSEASLTKEQKLKAERLRRVKLFTAMIKTGVPLSKLAESTSLDATPEVSVPRQGNSDSVDDVAKEREGSSVPLGSEISGRVMPQKGDYGIDHVVDHISKKKHRDSSRDDGQDDDSEGDEHSRKKHRHEHSVSHKHRKRHSSSRDKESRHHHKHQSSDVDDEYKHKKSSRSQHHHRDRDNSEDDDAERKQRDRHRRRRHDISEYDDAERKQHDRHRRRRLDTSEDDDAEKKHHDRHRRRRHSRTGSKEGREKHDTLTNLDQTEGTLRPSEDHQEAHVVGAGLPTSSSAEVPSDLRAKVRAMILETM